MSTKPTPPDHWQNIVENDETLASFIGDFQVLVGDGNFGYDRCPYPISASIYTGLRWHKRFDPASTHSAWEIPDLDSLYRAFFWRNALSTRYDQGFLSQLGTDLQFLKALLKTRDQYSSKSAWLENCDRLLKTDLMKGSRVPTVGELVPILTDGRPGGALQSAVLLPMVAGIHRDLDGIDISFPSDEKLELHHIFPRKWCANNNYKQSVKQLDEEESARDWVNSIANQMPLSRKTNNKWKDKSPATFLSESSVSYERSKEFFCGAYIDPDLYEVLKSDNPDFFGFWRQRATAIAASLVTLTNLTV